MCARTARLVSGLVAARRAVLDEDDRREFCRRGRQRSFEKNDKVFWQGDRGDSVHLVTKGAFAATASTRQLQSIVVNVVRTGEIFGELAVLGLEPKRSATMVALERSETYWMTREEFEAWRLANPRVERLLVRALVARVKEMTEQLLELTYSPPAQLVARRIVQLHDGLDDRAGGWITISQEQLAEYVSLRRTTVNPVLGRLEGAGYIERGRGRLRVLDVESLRRVGGRSPLE